MNIMCLGFFLAVFKMAIADIKPIYVQKNPKVECIVSYLLKNINIDEFKRTLLVVKSEIEDISKEDLSFADITVREAIKNQIPFIITNKISGVNITEELDRGTLFSLINFENCKAINHITKEMHKNIKYFIIISNKCESVMKNLLNELQYFEVEFFIPEQDEARFISLTIISEINEKSCLYDGRITKEKLIMCYSHLNGSEDITKSAGVLNVPLNLKKCKLNVGMASLYPYSTIKNKENLKTFDPLQMADIKGSDLEIIKIIANYFNATLNLHYVDRNEENPYFDTDYLKFLINGSLEVCLGGLYKIYGDVVSYSGAYSSQAIVWVYTVERNTRSWQKLVAKTHGLYIFLIFYVIHSMIWKIVCKFDDKAVSIKDTLFYSWGALVGAASLREARTVKQRTLNILYLIMCIYLSSYVSCQIYSYLTIQEPPPHYKTVDELQTSGKTPYLVPISKYFVKDKKYETFANTSGDCVHFDDCEVKLLKYNASTILIDGHLPFLQARTAVDDEARVLRVSNEILTIYHEMLIRKYSPILSSYRAVTQRLFESGICRKLYEEAMGITVVDRAKIAIKNILSNSYSCTVGCKITLVQLAGIFYLWIFGCCASFLVFIVEVIMIRERKA